MLGVSIALAWPSLFPQSIQVDVLPGDTRVPAGQPLTIRASVRAGRSHLTRFTPRLTVEAGSDARTVAMTPDGDGFQFSFESIDRTFRYRVTAGSRRSADYTVTALFGPRVAQIDLRYEYPPFANLPPREERDGGDIYAPAGTKVRVRVHTDKPIQSGQMVFAAGAKAGGSGALQPTGERVLEGDLVLARDDSYRIGLIDREGLRTAGDTEYFMRVMDDRPPDVRILRPAGDQQITPLEEVAIEARAEDDYGISRFDLVYAVAGREPRVIPFDRTSGSHRPCEGRNTHVRGRGSRRSTGRRHYLLCARARCRARQTADRDQKRHVLSRGAAVLGGVRRCRRARRCPVWRANRSRRSIAAQKEIINATWNIERRAASGAGRSSRRHHGHRRGAGGTERSRRADVARTGRGTRADALSSAAAAPGAS